MAATVELSGSRILVLGGSGVLGGLIAAELDRAGAKVMLAGRDPDRLREQASRIGASVPSVMFDLAVPSHATHVVDTAIQSLGGLDGLVNAAGVVAFGPLADMDDAALDELVAVDLLGPLRVMRVALPHLEGGFIVNISGVVAESPVAGMAAVLGRQGRVECGHHCPGSRVASSGHPRPRRTAAAYRDRSGRPPYCGPGPGDAGRTRSGSGCRCDRHRIGRRASRTPGGSLHHDVNEVLVVQVAATWFMVGLIWMVQVVHYPLFRTVPADVFNSYEAAHTSAIGRLLILPAGLEVVSAAALVWYRPDGVPLWMVMLSGALLAAIWVATALVQAPLHRRLLEGYDRAAVDRLIRTNWFRTGAWTLRGFLVAAMLFR